MGMDVLCANTFRLCSFLHPRRQQNYETYTLFLGYVSPTQNTASSASGVTNRSYFHSHLDSPEMGLSYMCTLHMYDIFTCVDSPIGIVSIWLKLVDFY